MKNNTSKIHKFFESLIYTILMTLPLINVFVRCIYVQSNPNAMQSYGTSTEYTEFNYQYTTNFVDNTSNDTQRNTLVNNNIYLLEFISNYGNSDTVYTFTTSSFKYFDLSVTGKGFISNNTNGNTTSRLQYRPIWNGNNTSVFYAYYGQKFTVVSTNTGGVGNGIIKVQMVCVFTNFDSVTFDYENIKFYECPKQYIPYTTITHETTDTLDNAFEYSLQKVVNEYGKGNINFVNWLDDLFFDNNNSTYFNFVNLYLNYALVVSVAYLLWFVLDWFIKFVKGLLNSLLPKGD